MKIWTLRTTDAVIVHTSAAEAEAHYSRIVAASWESWFNTPAPEDTAKAWNMLIAQCGFFDEVSIVEHEVNRNAGDDPNLVQAYREAARECHQEDGVLEVDDDAVISFGDDPGAYVQAWVWVSEEDL